MKKNMLLSVFVSTGVLFVLFFNFYCCNTDDFNKKYAARYIKDDFIFTDTVINYHFSGDTLFLQFPHPPDVKKWKFSTSITLDYLGEFTIEYSNVMIIDTIFQSKYYDTTAVHLFAITSDSILYARPCDKQHFMYYSRVPGKLSLVTQNDKYYRINLMGITNAGKDHALKQYFKDSICSILCVKDEKLLQSKIPNYEKY